MQRINQVGDMSCHQVPQTNVTDDQEGCSSDRTHPECNLCYDSHVQEVHFPFVIYVLCDQLKNGLGNALIDTGSQVSLVAETSLARGLRIKRQVIQIHGITGNVMDTKGQIDLRVGETSPHEFMLVRNLPMNCDILLGQDWLERFGYHFQIPDLGVNLPAYSETVVRIPTTEKGSRLVEAQELQENVFCASSVVECVDSSFICSVINCNSTNKILRKFPQTQELPKLSGKFLDAKGKELHVRNQVLQAQLRLAHVKEGEQEIRQICAEYVDVFKLPGDKLTATSAIKHHIPTPTIPANRSITLRNYRIPEHHQREIDAQIQQMLEDKIIQPSQSPWNFPILVVPKKLDASGKRKWRICVDFRKLNDVTVGDSFPLPDIQEILDKLGRARYFSALDCASGYWQVPLAEEDGMKTAFSTTTGHYEYLRMPFGLKSAPSTFQRLMNQVFLGLIGIRCFVYLDDVILFGETPQEHNGRLREIFERLRQFNVNF
jgi:hypothetical protein